MRARSEPRTIVITGSSDGIGAAAARLLVGSNFGAENSKVLRFLYRTKLKDRITITPEQGADQLVWLAEGVPGDDWRSGEYYEKRRPRVPRGARDEAASARLWDLSANWVGL